MVPWKSGNLLVWDATCSDTYAPSHLAQSTMAAGAVASQAEDLKRSSTLIWRDTQAYISPLKHQEYLVLFP